MFRRYFINRSLSFIGMALFLQACGDSDVLDDDSTIDNDLACSSENPSVTINGNHGHTLTIPIADIIDEVADTYTLTVEPGHTHTVSLSVADIQLLKEDGSLSKVTTTTTTATSTHAHVLTITCAG